MQKQAGVCTLVLLSLLLLSTHAVQAASVASGSSLQLDSAGYQAFYSSLLSSFRWLKHFWQRTPAPAPVPAIDLMEAAAGYDSQPPAASPDWYDESNEAGVPVAAPDISHHTVLSEEEEGLMPSQAAGETNMISYQITRPKSKAPAPQPHKRGPAAALQKRLRQEANSRKMHEKWLHAREAEWEPNRRQLAEAPTAGLNAFSLQEQCESISCGGKCCDSLFTYSSMGNTTCTEPAPTCSADGQCVLSKPNVTTGCDGLTMAFYDYPTNASSTEEKTMYGYTCPSNGDAACSFLNTYATDLSLCTEGACVPDSSGQLKCVPLSRGTSMYGCTAAIFTYTNAGNSAESQTARQGIRASNSINTPGGQQADAAG